jgi:hypothetical protein
MRMTRSRLGGVVITLLAAVSAIAVPAAPAAAAPGARALSLVHLWNLKSGLCMGVEGGHTNPGSRVLQWHAGPDVVPTSRSGNSGRMGPARSRAGPMITRPVS